MIFTKTHRELPSATQEDKEQEKERKQAKRVCHSQVQKRSQTSQVCRNNASQAVAVEAPVNIHKETEREMVLATQEERASKQAKHVRNSQELKRRQTSQVCRNGTIQLIGVEGSVDIHKDRDRDAISNRRRQRARETAQKSETSLSLTRG